MQTYNQQAVSMLPTERISWTAVAPQQELLQPEAIPSLQEFLSYCPLPTTKDANQ